MSEHDDLREIRRLDKALDGLAAGLPRASDLDTELDTEVLHTDERDTEVIAGPADTVPTGGGPAATEPIDAAPTEADELVALAAELLAAAPPPPEGAAARGRAALLAAAGSRRRRTLVRRAVLLAAALALVAVPAVATPGAEPGSALWPVRAAGQDLRFSLTEDAVERAHLRFNTAEEHLDKALERLAEHRDDPPDKLRERVLNDATKAYEKANEGLAAINGVDGPAADQARARGEQLIVRASDLIGGRLPNLGDLPAGGDDRDGGEPEDGDDRGRGGGDGGGGGGGDDRSGSSGSGSSGSGSSGSGSSGSGSSGSGSGDVAFTPCR
jgi:hypothetical protein